MVQLDGLVPGSAYSVWWVYFDDPAVCAIPWQCGPEDLRYETGAGPDIYPPGAFGRVGAVVARGNGKARFADTLVGLGPPDGAELWLVVLGHGPAAPRESMARVRQLLTPENFDYGGSFTGNDVDGPGSEWLAVARFTNGPEGFTGEDQ